MKLRLLIITLFLLPLYCAGQVVQRGVVKEYNEKEQKTALPGVEVNVSKASSTVSGADGTFELSFLTLKAGDAVSVRRIEKLGYEVFNREALEQWNLNPDKPFTVVMCRTDRFRKIRDLYEQKASESYARQREREEAALKKQLDEGAIKEQEYRQKMVEIIDSYEKQLDNLEAYVDRFARIDLSEISAAEQEIIDLVQEGRLDEAIARYTDMKLDEKIAQSVRQRDMARDAAEALARVADEQELTLDSLYARQQRRIDLLMLAGGDENRAEVGRIYRNIIANDSTNVEWLRKAALYIMETEAKYDEALNIMKSALAQIEAWPEKDPYYYGCQFRDLGALYTNTGNYDLAEEVLMQAIEEFHEVCGPESEWEAFCLNELYLVNCRIKNYDKALENILKAKEIMERDREENLSFLATYSNNIGALYLEKNNPEQALSFLNEADSLYRRANLKVHHSLINNFGAVYLLRDDYSSALPYYKEALSMQFKEYGERHPDIARSLGNISVCFTNLNELDSAIVYGRKALEMDIDFLGKSHPIIGAMKANLATLYILKKDYESAMKYLEEACQQLLEADEQEQWAVKYSEIGYVLEHTGRLSEALEHYEAGLKVLRKPEYSANPSLPGIENAYEQCKKALAEQ